MNGLVIALIAILVFLIWLRLDFILGLRKQRKEAKRYHQKVRYSRVQFYATGDEFFKNALSDIGQASDHIHLLFYIFQNDHIGTKVMKLLELKAKEGVTVRVLVDRFGCGLSRKSIKTLRKAGVMFAYSHPLQFPYLFFTLNRRNHRKLIVTDGRIGYIGGYNIGDEYLGRDPKFGTWRDYHLKLEGDGVQDLQEQFLQDWKTAKQRIPKEGSHFPSLQKGETPIRILPTDGTFLEETFIDLVNQAKHFVTLGTPYFIPGPPLKKALISAAKRGVNVRLVLPKKSDHPLVREAAFPYFKELIVNGVNIYQYYRGFFHAKAIVIDEQICDVGTANFDKRSFHINHEINCLIYDHNVVKKVLKELEHDISISERLTLQALEERPLTQRGKEKIATLISGLL